MKKNKIIPITAFLSIILIASSFFNFVGTNADAKATITLDYDQNQGTASIIPQLRSDRYEIGQAVKILVTPNPGYMIHSWVDNYGKESILAIKESIELNVILTANTNIKINFDEVVYYSLIVNTEGTGSGDINVSPSSTSFLAGTTVTLTANPTNGSTFMGWSGDLSGSAGKMTLIMDGNKSIKAQFDAPLPVYYTLTTATGGTGTGEIAVSPSGQSFIAGTAVTVTAIPTNNSKFEGWTGDATGTATQTVVVMNEDKSVTAGFARAEQQGAYTLTILRMGKGSVIACPYLPTYPAGTEVTLYVEEDDYWQFKGWGGAATGTAREVKITMNGNTNVTATFAKLSYPLTIASVGIGSGDVFVSGGYFDGNSYVCEAGSVVTVFAKPSADSRFGGFNGLPGNVGLTNPVVLQMDHAQSITAVFLKSDNQKPVAVNDQYSAIQNSVLSVSNATGVLANDRDNEGQSLSVTSTSEPAHGALVLNQDGSFVYKPEEGFIGIDYFAYVVSDGAQSDLATVTITVK